VRQSSPGYEALERFLTALKLPFLTRISDSDNYVSAVGRGMGVFEMEETATHAERQELAPIFRWLDGHETVSVARSASDNVVSIEKSGKFSALRSTGKALVSNLISATGRFKIVP
jgi:hypothetical protein